MVQNYALDIQEYTLKNALCYGLFKGHFQKAFNENNSSYGRRFVHFLIVVAELLPIASIFELAIVQGATYLFGKKAADASTNSNPPSAVSIALRNHRPAYSRLPNAEEIKNIHYIANMSATSYTATILWHRKSLTKANLQLLSLHPLRMLAYLHNDKDLHEKMTLIKNRPSISLFGKTISIWEGVRSGMAYRLTYYMADRQTFDREYAQFAKDLKLSPPPLIPKPIPEDTAPQDRELARKMALADTFMQPVEDKF